MDNLFWPARGHVTLVGAGPGDPELLTVKAIKALQAATVLFVDDLVNPAILAYANPNAQRVAVGKRGGRPSTPQESIEQQLYDAACSGENVVRLKGGDPFIFGRGGEEVAHLQAAGITVTVINGITAGLAASTALNVALTHRDCAQGVVFITGHPQTGKVGTNWTKLGNSAAELALTLVIYMGMGQATAIQEGLLRALPATTPVAVVQHASLPSQQHLLSSLAEFAQQTEHTGLGSPAIIIVGDVLVGMGRLASAHPQICQPAVTALPF